MADVLKAHIEICHKHPMSRLKAELAVARQEHSLCGDVRAGMMEHLDEADFLVAYRSRLNELADSVNWHRKDHFRLHAQVRILKELLACAKRHIPSELTEFCKEITAALKETE
jgi:predicted heme/steroid binding protein